MLLSRTTTCTRHSLLSLLWGTRIAAPRGVAAEPGPRAPSPLARRSRTIARPRRLPEALPGAAFPAHLGAVPFLCPEASMAILKIARMGHPVLLREADPVPDPTAPEIRRLVADMAETMRDAQGIGLAAPQV